MISRSESKRLEKNKRHAKLKQIFLKILNLLFKSYMYLGFSLIILTEAVNLVYKSYLHRNPPFFDRIPSDNINLAFVITAVITTFLLSGMFALLTEQKKVVQNPKKDEELSKSVEKQVRKRRRRNKAA